MHAITAFAFVVVVALVGCKNERDKIEERCIAMLKREQKCFPPPNTAEGAAIRDATDGGGYSKLGLSSCMLTATKDRSAMDRSDQRLAAAYDERLACAASTTTCEEFIACGCKTDQYMECHKKAPQ